MQLKRKNKMTLYAARAVFVQDRLDAKHPRLNWVPGRIYRLLRKG